ncbi:putative glutaredoxin-C14 [Aristolochia californica]|uniref:putative glutaredoxin-C14 n=1 Tax=Aristolochia californica TaxID=171875 RepID=UPI0035D6D4FE
MHQAIPYRTWVPVTGLDPSPLAAKVKGDDDDKGSSGSDNCSTSERVWNLASENAVLVVGRRGCCMCHVVKRLLLGLGVNPLVHEVEDGKVIFEISGDQSLQFPAVFIGGKLVGGLEWLMAAHISGELIPILKKAGALWL